MLARLVNRDRLWRRRRWIIALSVLLLVRAVLPEILRRVMIAQATKLLHARVDIGDVDLALYRGGIALEDVAVRSAGDGADDVAPPLLAWKRLDIEIRWLPLFRKTVRLQYVLLDSPRVAVDRLANGQLNLLALLPASAETPPATESTPVTTPAPAAGGEWGFGLDRVVLSDGGVRFRDFTLKDSEPIELTLPHVEVTDIALDQGVYGAPSQLHLAVAFDQGSLDLSVRLTLRDDGMTVAANLNAWGLPLRQTRLYIPAVGWSAFDGSLDAALTYRADSGRQNEVSGTVALHDVSVQVPGLDAPALAWRNLTLRVDPLDLIAQRINVTDVELSGASLPVRLHGGVLLPLLAASLHDAAADAASSTPAETVPATPAETPGTATAPPEGPRLEAPAPETPTPTTETQPTATATVEITPTPSPTIQTPLGETTETATPQSAIPEAETQPAGAAESKPWTWSVASAHINDSAVHLLGREAPLDIGLQLNAGDLTGDADYPGHVGLALTLGDGSMSVDAALRLHRLGLAGTLRTANLSVPEILVSATTLPTDLLRSGHLSTELTIEAGMAVPDGGALAPRDVRVHGHVALAEAQLTTPAAAPLSIAARSVDLELKDLHVAGALPGDPAETAPTGAGSLAAGDVHLDGTLSLAEPSVATPDGSGVSAAARLIELTLADVTGGGVLSTAPGVPTRGDLQGSVHLAVAEVHAAPTGPQGVAVDGQALDLGITDLSAQGLLAPAPAAAADVRWRDGRLSLADFKLASADPKALQAGARSLELTLSSLSAGGVLATAPGAPTRGDLQAGVHVVIGDVHAAAEQPQNFSMAVQSLDLGIADISAQGLLTAAPAAPAGLHLRDGRLSLGQLELGTQGLSMDTQTLDLGIAEISAQGLLAIAPAPPATTQLRDGRLSLAQLKLGGPGFSMDTQAVDLGIADLSAQPANTAAASDVRLRNGRVSLAQFRLAGADPKVFLAGTRSFDLPINELNLPGNPEQPIRATVGDIRLVNPTALVTRTADGLLLPQFAPASSAAPAAQAPPAPHAQPRLFDVAISSFRLTDGQVTALDRSVQPFFKGGLDPLNVDLRGVRWPTLAADKIHVTATGPEKGTIEVFGALQPDEGWFEVYGDELALLPYNPYATSFSSYSIGRGALSLVTKGSFKNGRYYAGSSVTLHQLNLESRGGESLFQQYFGIPIEMALALMRDLYGNIVLDIPIEADAQGTKIDVLAVVGGALRHAIVNALASPLKLIGAVFSGSDAKVAAPAPIAFRPGRAELDPSGSQQVDQLAAFMAARPGIGVTLETSVTNTDVRWLREQALLQAWDAAGVLGTLRGLTQRSSRDRVRHAIEARAKDAPGDLSAEDAGALDAWLDEQPPIPAERLRGLANERLSRTAAALQEGHGLDATRVTRREPATDVTDGPPAVRVEIGSVGG